LRLKVRSPRDFGAAVVFALVGAAGLFFGRDLAFGTAADMGPGYFPVILSALILALGLGLGFRATAVEGPAIEAVRLRPLLLINAAILLFGYLMPRVGLALTTLLLTLLAAYARREVRLGETLLLGAALALFSVGVFVYALGQPLSPWWGN